MKNILLILAVLFVTPIFSQAAEKPNIILLMGDDHGWEETAYNGHKYLKTPVLDEMAATGLRLNNFYAGHPTCSPTRGSFLTGRHPNRFGTFVPNYSMRPEEITIGHIAKKAGYRTSHFGKWHVGPVKKSSPTSPGAMGFDEWLSHDNFFELDPVLSRNGGKPEKILGESSEILIENTIEFIKKVEHEEKPFLSVVWFGSPHEPYSGLPKDLALYDNLPDKYSKRKVSLTSNETGKRVTRPLKDVLRERYAEITAMDRAIGKLRDYLKETGQKENTLLWYCGDNGTPKSGFAESPLRGMKATMYEGGIRVPGLIEWPAKIKSPRTSNISSVTSDMLPTICSLLNQPLPKRPIDGIDLVPLLDGKMTSRETPICFWGFDLSIYPTKTLKPYIQPELQKGTTPLVKLMKGIPTRNFVNYVYPEINPANFSGDRVILDGDYKLKVTKKGSRPETVELFNLKGDLAETKNLAEMKPEIVNRMKSKLNNWQQSVLESLTGADY